MRAPTLLAFSRAEPNQSSLVSHWLTLLLVQSMGTDGLTCKFSSCWFLTWLALQPWRWRWHVPVKHLLTFTGLHSIISQKIELLITRVHHGFIPLTQQIKVQYHYRCMLWFIHYQFRSQMDHLQVIRNLYITCYSYCRYWKITMDPCKRLSAIYLNLLYKYQVFVCLATGP
jgi:hypothetical protein